MGIVAAIVLMLCGAAAASSLIIARRPDAKPLLDKLLPIQGYLGVVAAIWGVWIVIQVVLNASVFTVAPFHASVAAAVAALTLGLGFLLGYGLISKYALSKNAAAAAKGEQIRAKLIRVQGPMGLAAIAVAGLSLVSIFI